MIAQNGATNQADAASPTKRRTEVRLMLRRVTMARLLMPFLASALTSGANFATVFRRPCGRPSFESPHQDAINLSPRRCLKQILSLRP